MKVDFLVIGAMKSGTTTLHRNLALHPKLGLSDRKEANYFSKNFDKGEEYFWKYLAAGDILGECSPSYAMRHIYPQTARRIHEYNPKMKLIYILRDPIERIFSHVHHDLYRDRLTRKKVDEVVLKNTDYKLTSSYFWQLEAYLEYFDASQILIIDFAEMYNLDRLMDKVFQFLGLDKFSTNFSKYYSSDQRYLIKYHDLVQSLNSYYFRKLYHALFYLFQIKIDKPILSDEVIMQLTSELLEDTQRIKEWSGLEFTWKYFS